MFYHLQSTTMSPCSLAKDAYEQAQHTWLCTGCCAPMPGTGAIDVKLEEPPSLDTPLNGIMGCGVPIALHAFLDAIGDDADRRDLLLGRMYGPDGVQLDEWATFRGRHRLIIRGSKNVSHRQCSNCGRHVYFAMGKRYLFPEPPKDVEIFESDLFGLVLSERLFSLIELSKWKNISVDELPVLKEPKDSLGDLQ